LTEKASCSINKLMKIFRFFLVALGVFGALLVARQVFAQPSLERKIVVFKPGVSQERKARILARYQVEVGKELRLINGKAVKISRDWMDKLAKDPEVLRVDPDVEVYALPREDLCTRYPWLPWCKPTPTPTPTPTSAPTPTPTPTPTVTPTPTPTSAPTPTPTPTTGPTPTPTLTPTPGTQPIPWGVARINADDAWVISTGAGIKVAVLDTGIDRDHPDLDANLTDCLNFIQSWKTCEDDNGHGTHVSGIIAGENNSFGVVGVAPNAKIYSLKVLDSRGSGYLSDVIEGLDWAVANKMQVVNMSLGTSSDVASFSEAVKRVSAAGITQVAAAGNSGPGAKTVLYPAKYPEVIAVSASDSSDGIPSWSSRGPEIDLAAPGVNINSTYLNGKYKVLSGTSMAAPHVAGTVALRLFLKPGETPSQIETILEANTDPLPLDPKLVGAGLVNALKVVSAP
jgi:subtilisin family serine protease